MNCGQTCIAPDFLIVDNKIKSKLIIELKNQIIKTYGEKPIESVEYGRIISEKHIKYLSSLIENQKILYGGNIDIDKKHFSISINEATSHNDIQLIVDVIAKGVEKDSVIVSQTTSESKIPKDYVRESKFLQTKIFNIHHSETSLMRYIKKLERKDLSLTSMILGSTCKNFHISIFQMWIDPPLRYPPFKNKINFLKKLLKLIYC